MKRAAAGLLAALAAAGLACGDDLARTSGDDAAPPARRASFRGVRFDARGVSEEIVVEVPPRTRSLTVVARGDPEALYALAWLEVGGVEHVQLPDDVADLGEAMREQYFDEQVGAMPGALHQSIRLGTFTHVHPNRPGVELSPGPAVLRIATSDPSRPVDVEVFMPDEDGARTLPIHVFAVSDQRAYDPDRPAELPFLPSLREILGQAGLAVEVEQVINLPGTGLANMTEISEPQEPPTSVSSQLALLAGGLAGGDALAVFVVDSLPRGVAGWSLGTPGPPMPDTYYSGVVAANHPDGDELGRVLAHEISHYLGLWHVVNIGRSGARYPDPLEDTEPSTGNLMEGGGRLLTPGQAFVLGRSPLLR